MNWIFETEKKQWVLIYEGEKIGIIRIFFEPDNPVYKFKVKTYFSQIIISSSADKKNIAKKNIVWLKKYSKKFKTEWEYEKYVELKKQELEKSLKESGFSS